MVPDPSDELALRIVSFRVSPPGEGKSLLNQHFGHIRKLRDRNLNRGEEGSVASDADSTGHLIYGMGKGSPNTEAIVFDREKSHNKNPLVTPLVNKLMSRVKEIKVASDGSLLLCENSGSGRLGRNLQAATNKVLDWKGRAQIKFEITPAVEEDENEEEGEE